MRIRSALAATILLLTAYAVQALEPRYYTVYSADGRIEVSMWDLEQLQVRRGSDVCQFTRYTSYSSALTFADKNFGGEGEPCFC